jgi:hypothetical protein
MSKGGVIAEVVSRRLPTAAVQIRSQVSSRGICGGQIGAGAGFLRVLWFLLPISFHRLIHTHLPSGAGTAGQLVAAVPSGFSLTPPPESKEKLKLCVHIRVCICV